MANPNARRSGGGCFSLAIRVGIVAFIIYVGIGFLNGEVKMPRASSPQAAAPFVLDDLPTPAPKQYTTLYIDEGVTFEVHGPSGVSSIQLTRCGGVCSNGQRFEVRQINGPAVNAVSVTEGRMGLEVYDIETDGRYMFFVNDVILVGRDGKISASPFQLEGHNGTYFVSPHAR
jgi:hypothetical protein